MPATVVTGRPGPHCTCGTSGRPGSPRLAAPLVEISDTRPRLEISDTRPRLKASVRPGPDGVCVVAVEGELDIATQGALGAALTDVLARYGPDIVVDASGISFCDARGLSVLVRGANRAERAGGSLTMAGMPPSLRSLLRMVGLDQRLGGSSGAPTA